jgi:hypothetical protein
MRGDRVVIARANGREMHRVKRIHVLTGPHALQNPFADKIPEFVFDSAIPQTFRKSILFASLNFDRKNL